MKKYVTFVKDEEESKAVQEALVKAGFGWLVSGQIIQHQDNHFLYIEGLSITSCDDFKHITMDITDGHVAINAADIIENPFQLDGAKKPEPTHTIAGKEYSESTMLSALREYVG